MGVRIANQFLRLATRPSNPILAARSFATTAPKEVNNRIYPPVRTAEELSTYILLSSSSRQPLLTFWTTSYCPTCRNVSPLIQSLIDAGVGTEQGGVSFAEIEYDSPDIMTTDIGMRYMITKIPTLMAFDRGEPQIETRVVDGKKLTNEAFLRKWIEDEANRHGNGGAGGSFPGTEIFGGWFGRGKS